MIPFKPLVSVFLAAFALSACTLAHAQSTPDTTPDQFVDIADEPRELEPLETLINYPEVARRSGLEGKVTLEALIGKDGRVDSVIILKSDYDIFKDAAIDAMKHEKFTPAMYNSTPLKVWITRTINFKLQDKSWFGNFKAIMGASKAQVLSTFQDVGNLDEVEKTDGIYLHAESPTGFSEGTHPESMDGIIGDSGLRQITVFYRCDNDNDFNATTSLWNINKFSGGNLLSANAEVEFPGMIMSIASNAKAKTLRVVLTSK